MTELQNLKNDIEKNDTSMGLLDRFKRCEHGQNKRDRKKIRDMKRALKRALHDSKHGAPLRDSTLDIMEESLKKPKKP